MASADSAHGTAAMAVDSRGNASSAVLGEEEEIDGTLASLLLASWPTSAVVDDSFRRFPWDLGGPLVEQRYADLEGRRIVSLCTTNRANYDPLYAVPEGTATDFPFLRLQNDWRVRRVLRHLAERVLPPRWATSPTSVGTITQALSPRWVRRTARSSYPALWGSGQSAPLWESWCSMSSGSYEKCWCPGVRPCTRSPPFDGLR